MSMRDRSPPRRDVPRVSSEADMCVSSKESHHYRRRTASSSESIVSRRISPGVVARPKRRFARDPVTPLKVARIETAASIHRPHVYRRRESRVEKEVVQPESPPSESKSVSTPVQPVAAKARDPVEEMKEFVSILNGDVQCDDGGDDDDDEVTPLTQTEYVHVFMRQAQEMMSASQKRSLYRLFQAIGTWAFFETSKGCEMQPARSWYGLGSSSRVPADEVRVVLSRMSIGMPVTVVSDRGDVDRKTLNKKQLTPAEFKEYGGLAGSCTMAFAVESDKEGRTNVYGMILRTI